MASTEDAYRQRDTACAFPPALQRPEVHAPNSLLGFVAAALGLRGPQLTVATACSSSARVFGSAERLLRAGLVDAAIVGGVDTLCLSVLYGFNALELMSGEPCRPFDQRRKGLNIGEGAGFAILERASDCHSGAWFSGYGESSDAHHMSSPHPDGLGAQLVMRQALQRARLHAGHIDYINLHGTATRMNDQIEAQAIHAVFSEPVACSATKGWTGHTLGAAGIVEAAITLLSLDRQQAPGTLNCDQPEVAMCGYLQQHTASRTLRHVLSNSFGFGGNNCALLFSREHG